MQNSKGLSNARMNSRLRSRLRVRVDVGVRNDFLFAITLEQNILRAGSGWDIWSLRSQKSKSFHFYFLLLDSPFFSSNLVFSFVLVHFFLLFSLLGSNFMFIIVGIP
jgi:hypothetical protein